MNIYGFTPLNGVAFAMQEVENIPLGKLVEVFHQHPDWYSAEACSSTASDVGVFLHSALEKQCIALHDFIQRIRLTDSIECLPPSLESGISHEIYTQLTTALAHNYEHRAFVDRFQAQPPAGLEFEHFKAMVDSIAQSLVNSGGVLAIIAQDSQLAKPFSLDHIPDDNLKAMAYGIAKFLGLPPAYKSVQLRLAKANLSDVQAERLASQLQILFAANRIRSVDLSYNHLTDAGFNHILARVDKLTPCTSIDVKGNKLTDLSLVHIANWLGEDQSAITFDLSKNPQMHRYSIPKIMEDKFLVILMMD